MIQRIQTIYMLLVVIVATVAVPMLFSIDLPGSSLKLSGMKKAATTPASVA